MEFGRNRFAALLLFLACTSANAELTTFTDEVSFQGAVVGELTVANLNGVPLSNFATTFQASDAGPKAAFEGMGLSFVGVDPRVIGGQQGQIAKSGRDRLLLNGDGFAFYGDSVNSGNVAINFLLPTTAFGAWVNVGDVSTIIAYSGANRTGGSIGQVDIASGGFGGLISSSPFGSVEILCELEDHKCGIFDIQLATAVPEPSAYMTMLAALGLMGIRRCTRRTHPSHEHAA